MKLDKLVGARFKETPSDCVIESHALMARGGYMKQVANGIFSSYPPLRRICRKIEEIVREEMDAIGGQEVQFPVVMPASLWEESGRYESVGDELVRLRDRAKSSLVLGMTHEEAAVQLVRDYAVSHANYPFMIYQIQTKFRDEARPRGGLIRVREFTMKDAYSFHTSGEDLDRYYDLCHRAYERIFARVGLPEVISVASDSGMMGGSVSHEFMLITPVGEDSIVLCPKCGYRANMEAAPCIVRNERGTDVPLTAVYTPGARTIDEVCAFLGLPREKSCKSVVYERESDGGLVAVFLRGDLEVSATKLVNLLGCGVVPADLPPDVPSGGPESGLVPGYIGPVGLPAGVTALFDRSLEGANGLCCGANREETHYTGLDLARDLPGAVFTDLAKAVEGGICPSCGKPTVTVSRGIEVGNIFELGTKYTRAMGMRYLDADGSLQIPLMGCYGIGVGRLAASVCEARRDENGPIWPISIAPWQAHLVALRADDETVRSWADRLYEALESAGIETIYDDRRVSAGVQFSDADLLGVPVRVVVSPRNCKDNSVEIVARDKSFSFRTPIGGAAERIADVVRRLLKGEPVA